RCTVQALSREEKSGMLQRDEPEATDGVRHRPGAVFEKSRRVPCAASRASLSRWADHRFAILVDQGSDPTVPYQALVIRGQKKGTRKGLLTRARKLSASPFFVSSTAMTGTAMCCSGRMW